jgi:hypothetical protein
MRQPALRDFKDLRTAKFRTQRRMVELSQTSRWALPSERRWAQSFPYLATFGLAPLSQECDFAAAWLIA